MRAFMNGGFAIFPQENRTDVLTILAMKIQIIYYATNPKRPIQLLLMTYQSSDTKRLIQEKPEPTWRNR